MRQAHLAGVRWLAALALLALVAIAASGIQPARRVEAGTAHPVTIGPSGGFLLAGQTFAQVETALTGLSVGEGLTVPVAIPNLATLLPVSMELNSDGTNRVVTMLGSSVQPFPAGSPLAGVSLDVLLVARWDSDADTAPDIALAIRVVNADLATLFSRAVGGPALPLGLDGTPLAEALVVLTPTPGITLNPLALPVAVKDFLGVEGTLTESLVLAEVSSLLSRIDLSQNAALAAAAAYLSYDANEALVLAGSLADSAASLFADETDFSQFSLTVSLDDAAPFLPPYGLDVLGAFTNAELGLRYNGGTQVFEATFDAGLMIGGSSQDLHIHVIDDYPSETTAIVTISGGIPLGDVVDWLAGTTVFGDAEYAQVEFESANLEEIEFSFDREVGVRTVMGLHAAITDIQTFGANLTVEFLLGLDAPDVGDPTLLAALNVVDPGCTTTSPDPCIDLTQVFDFPGASVDIDLTLPAINLLAVYPGGQFTTSKLGAGAKEFLDEVNGAPADEPFIVTGDLNFIADVPIGDLQTLLTPLGLSSVGTHVHVQGSAGFTLTSLDTTTVTLDNFHVEGSFAGFTSQVPEGFPAWLAFPGSGSWTFFLDFAEGGAGDADDVLAVGAKIEGIEVPDALVPDLPDLVLEAKFSGTNLAGPNPDWTITASVAFGESWSEPFGLTFLTVEEAAAVLTITPDDASAELCGLFDIGGVDFRICAAIASLSPPTATFRVDLITPVTLDQALAALPGGLLANVQLPAGIGGNSIGPGSIEFQVNGQGEFTVGVVAAINAQVFGFQLPFELMLTGTVGGSQSFGALGLKLQPGASLGSLIGQPDLPVNLPLSPPTPPAGEEAVGGFAFVFSTGSLAFDSAQLPGSVESWFRPLYGGDLGGQEFGGVAGVVGAIALPEPLAGFVSQMGMDPNVLVHGSLGLDPIAVELGMTLRLRDGILPEFIDGVELELSVAFEASPAPALVFGLEGSMYLKFKQGMDAGLASQLQAIGVNLPVALPVASGFVCPRGGFNLPTTEDDLSVNNYCYDKLKIFIGTELGVTASPPEVFLRAYGGMVTQNTGGAAWSPLGIEEIGIGSLGAEVEISFAAGPPFSLNLKVGLYGDITLFDYDVSAGIKVGVSVFPATTPIGIGASPSFEGLRISFPDGLETNAIIDLSNAIAEAVGAPQLPYPNPATFPNIALKNLYFSISPLGAPTVCIEQGLIFRGDLYINPPAGLDFDGGPPCDPTAEPPVGYSVDPDETCEAMASQGCVAGVFFSLTPDGLIATAFLTGFEIEPLQMRFDDTILAIKLTLAEQYIRIHSGIEIGPEGNPNAIGRMSIDIQLGSAVFAGQLKAFGFNALVDGSVSVNPLNFFTGGPVPGFTLHVVLAAPTLSAPQYDSEFPDFSERVRTDLERTIDDVAEVVEFIEAVVEDFPSHPVGTLVGLPERLEDAGYGPVTPEWVDDIADQLAALELLMGDREEGFSFEDLINGFELDGVEIGYVTCIGIYADGVCWGQTVEPFCTGLDIGGHCYLWPPLEWGGICSLQVGGIYVFPEAIRDDGYCEKEEFEAELRRVLETLIYQVEAFTGLANFDPTAIIDTADAWLNAGPGVTVFGLQCAALDVELSLLGNNAFDIAFDGTLLDNNFQLLFSWDFDDPLGSAARLFTALVSGTGNNPCEGVNQDLFGEGGLGNPDAADPDEEELPPLSVTISAGPASVNEGSSVSAVVALNRPVDAADLPVSVTVDWGDGSADTVLAFEEGDSSLPASHVYADDDPTGTASDATTITATMTSPDASSDSTVITVKNVAPSALGLLLSSASIDEGGTVQLTVSWSDPGTADTHSVRVNWGDGSVQLFSGAGTFSHTYLDDRPSGTPSDLVNIAVRVRDDDTGIVEGTTSLTVNNVRPDASSIAFSLTEVQEGAVSEFTIRWDDVGTRDTYVVSIDWDSNGTFDETWPAGTSRSLTVLHQFVDDHPNTGTPWDDLTVRVQVVDDDTGTAESNETVRVNNVAPTLCIVVDPDADDPVVGNSCLEVALTIDELGSVTVRGVFQDPGVRDTHTVTIDWDYDGTPGRPGFPDTVVILAPDPQFPSRDWRTFSASQAYGDNDIFVITVTVVDDDTGTAAAAATVTVNNVNPTVAIDETPAVGGPGVAGTVDADGSGVKDDGDLDEPTFITRAGTDTTFSAHATDPGSDDLTFTWNWGDTLSSIVSSLVNPSLGPDPLPSPSVQPRDFDTTAVHSWTKACLYQVMLDALDDDGGTAHDDTWVVVTGTEKRIWAPGYWFNQYDMTKKNQNRLAEATLECYRNVVNHMSRVFGDGPTGNYWRVHTFPQMRDALNTKQTAKDTEIMQRQLLAAWLNFANGSVTWFGLVDTNRDGIGDTPFHALMAESEALRLSSTATRAQLLAQEDKLKSANND